MNKVTAIIPSLANEVTKAHLRLCVESLRATVDWDIVVVTNGAKAPEPLNIEGITRRLHTSDQGQGNAVNIGAQGVHSEYIFIINDDMYFAPDWNNNLDFRFPVFSPNLVEPINNHGSADPFLKCDGGFNLDEFDRDLVDGFIKALVGKKTGDTKIEQGFNFPVFIEKKLWDFLGGYDLAYDPWGSNGDTDLQTRINLAGVTPMRLRDVLVYHFSNKSGTFDGTHQDYYLNNLEYFKSKFGFDRDELGSDVWYNKDMIPKDKERIKYEQKPYIS